MTSARAIPFLVLLLAACGPSGEKSPVGGSDIDAGTGTDGEGQNPCAGGRCENACPSGQQTTVSGRVLAPNGVDPIPYAQVFVPVEVAPIEAGVACELCSAIDGNALVKVTSGVDGSF